jgi:hypothetical protein
MTSMKRGLDQKEGETSRNQAPLSLFLAAVVLAVIWLARGGFQMIFSKQRPYEEPEPEDLSAVLSYLQEHLGSEMTAYVSGADNPTLVSKWVDGTARPQPSHEVRLRPAYEAARYVVEAYGDETARQWFFGINPSLQDTAPAYVLRHGPPAQWEVVVPAALEFVENAR